MAGTDFRTAHRAAIAFCFGVFVFAGHPSYAQSFVNPEQRFDPSSLTEAGNGALGTRDYERARENFLAALNIDPGFKEAQRGLARAEMGLGRYQEAEMHIGPLRDVSPGYRLDGAALLLVSGRTDQALAEIDKARVEAQSHASQRDGGQIGREFLKKMHMLRGDTLYRLGGYDAALAEYESAGKVMSGADVWRAIGDVHLAVGSPETALGAYSEALSLRRFDSTAYQRRARVKFQMGDVEGALDDYAEAELGLNETPALLGEMAETYIAAGAYGSAVSTLNRLLVLVEKDPVSARIVRWNLASALIERGTPREAERKLAEIGEWPGMEVPMLFLQARARFGQGDYQSAHQLLSQALRLKQGDPSLLYNRGLAALRAGHIERALDDFGEGLKNAPQSTEIRDAIGKVRLYQGQLDEGLLIYNVGVERNPADPQPRIQRARALLAINMPEAALEDAQNAAKLDPSSVAAAGVASSALLDLDRPEDALGYADRLIQSRTGKKEGYILRARAYIALGRANDGLSSLEQAHNLGAPEGELEMLKGEAHLVNGDYEDAVLAFDRALALSPTYAEAHEKRGDALTALGKLSLAAQGYQSALATASTNAVDLRMKRAEVLRKDARCSEALADYEIVLAQLPDNSAALRGRGKCKMREGALIAGLRDMVGSFF